MKAASEASVAAAAAFVHVFSRVNAHMHTPGHTHENPCVTTKSTRTKCCSVWEMKCAWETDVQTKQSRKNTNWPPRLIYDCVLIRNGGGATTKAASWDEARGVLQIRLLIARLLPLDVTSQLDLTVSPDPDHLKPGLEERCKLIRLSSVNPKGIKGQSFNSLSNSIDRFLKCLEMGEKIPEMLFHSWKNDISVGGSGLQWKDNQRHDGVKVKVQKHSLDFWYGRSRISPTHEFWSFSESGVKQSDKHKCRHSKITRKSKRNHTDGKHLDFWSRTRISQDLHAESREAAVTWNVVRQRPRGFNVHETRRL